MNDEMQEILIDIFPLIVEVNFNTEYRANINIQPTFENFHQVPNVLYRHGIVRLLLLSAHRDTNSNLLCILRLGILSSV